MLRRRGVVADEPAKVDDSANASARRCVGEVLRRLAVEAGKLGPGRHGMHQIVGDLNARQSRRERVRVEAVAADDLSAW